MCACVFRVPWRCIRRWSSCTWKRAGVRSTRAVQTWSRCRSLQQPSSPHWALSGLKDSSSSKKVSLHMSMNHRNHINTQKLASKSIESKSILWSSHPGSFPLFNFLVWLNVCELYCAFVLMFSVLNVHKLWSQLMLVCWPIGLTSRIKKQCFRIIRKIPFIGGAVSISGDSVPSFYSWCALTYWPYSYESLLDDWIQTWMGAGDRPLAHSAS